MLYLQFSFYFSTVKDTHVLEYMINNASKIKYPRSDQSPQK